MRTLKFSKPASLFLSLLLFAVFSVSAAAAPEVLDTAYRSDGSKITYRVHTPGSLTPQPLVVMLHGSTCRSNASRFTWTKELLKNSGYALLGLEKPGIHGPLKDGHCPQEYLERNTITQRIADHKTVIGKLATDLQNWNGRIIWVGGSEGGMVAGLLAAQSARTQAVVMLVSAGGMSFADEMRITLPRLYRKHGVGEAELRKLMSDFERTLIEIRQNPTSLQSFLGNTNTYRWWAAIMDVVVVDHLFEKDFPMLLVHGTADESAPIEAADAFAEKFADYAKTNLTYFRYEGLDHGLKDSTGKSYMTEKFKNDILPWIQQPHATSPNHLPAP